MSKNKKRIVNVKKKDESGVVFSNRGGKWIKFSAGEEDVELEELDPTKITLKRVCVDVLRQELIVQAYGGLTEYRKKLTTRAMGVILNGE